ncbi:alkyldihydroxyacetonephosphate synthase, peroxisomal [Onthophagus taurus]|uniref:alkyldihydroxyacetonephosphate synthase, peroxisomal n=1 Tax=Onthophagus taurus TaxID=166361 RepID=UPI0039BE66A3
MSSIESNDKKSREGPNNDSKTERNRVENIDFKASAKEEIIVRSVIPKRRQDLLKWNGWGYKDSKFVVKDDVLHFTGDRYPGIGDHPLPYFTTWVKEKLGVDIDQFQKPQDPPNPEDYPPVNLTDQDFENIKKLNVSYSIDGEDRLIRAHGHTLDNIYKLRRSFFKRIPDIILWPTSHDDVVKIVNFAQDNNLVLIPFGGGTAVSGAIECPDDDRTIISLDTSQMNKILWVDRENLVICCESGIFGQDLERELKRIGFTSGHEPDSYEFSSLGGWVATRASGMKKNVYGNIEDLVIHVKMVTPKGVLEKNCQVPRISCGPDFDHLIMGSEGCLGVITEVIFKIRPLPELQKYGSIVFPNFESGAKCMREVAKLRCQPASIRLMDNDQFKFGQSLKPKYSFFGLILEGLKKIYINKIKGMDFNSLVVMTLLFEGNSEEVGAHEKKIYEISSKFGGIPAGETNGKRGYMLTFLIAYIRDLGLEYHIVAESFETSVSWDRVLTLCNNVKHRIKEECSKRNLKYYMNSCRLTQTYDAGCVIYFYFCFNYCGVEDPVKEYEAIEEIAREEIIASGGSISHHHGVGKLRRKWYGSTVSDVGVSLFKAAKKEIDPKNIFALENLVKSKM